MGHREVACWLTSTNGRSTEALNDSAVLPLTPKLSDIDVSKTQSSRWRGLRTTRVRATPEGRGDKRSDHWVKRQQSFRIASRPMRW